MGHRRLIYIVAFLFGFLPQPAITLALTIVGALDWKRGVILSFFQYLAGIAAAALISGLFPGMVNSRTTLSDGMSTNRGFWLEVRSGCAFFMAWQLWLTSAHTRRSFFCRSSSSLRKC